MRFLFTLFAAVAGFTAVAGVILKPSANTTITSGVSLAFDYSDINWCHAGYSPISLWLSDAAPTGLTSTGDLPAGTFIKSYGTFLVPNFGTFPVCWHVMDFTGDNTGLPSMAPVPPSNITIPDISTSPAGSTLFFTVVETAPANACPPVRDYSWVTPDRFR
jgi:hypothetical protein